MTDNRSSSSSAEQSNHNHSADGERQPQARLAASVDTSTEENVSLESMSAMITAAIEMSNKGRPTSSLSLGHASIIPSSSAAAAGGSAAKLSRSRSSSVRSFFTGSSRRSTPPQTNDIVAGPSITVRPKRSSSMSSQHSLPLPRRSASTSTNRYPSRFSWLVTPSASAETSKKVNDTIVEEPRLSEDDIDDGKRELMYRGIQVREIKTTLKTMVVPQEVERPMPNVKIERPSFARINY